MQKQQFRKDDEVIDIILNQRGFIKEILGEVGGVRVFVEFYDKDYNFGCGWYKESGECDVFSERPTLLHYIDGYDYSKIDFNNLPKKLKE